MFAGRTTTDVVVILFALAITLAIVGAGATLAALAITDRTENAADVVGYLESVLTTALGAVLGLIAGRARTSSNAPPTTTTEEGPTP